MRKPAMIFIFLIPIAFNTIIAESATDWFPLAEGNWWLYESEGFLLDGSDTTLISGTVLTEIREVLDHDSGFQVYSSRTITNTSMSTDTSEGFLRHTDEELRCYYSLNLDLYDVWITYTETTTEPEVVVPAGSFENCTVITLPVYYETTMELFFHRGTGLVKSEYSSDSYNTTESLSAFNLN